LAPIFASGGFVAVEVTVNDSPGVEYRMWTWTRSTMGCSAIYDATLGPVVRINCQG